jgi:ribosomal protein S18 acetylase RimI-like enzyme
VSATNDVAVHVRLGTPTDAEPAARLHASTITEGYLSSLGTRFLARLYRRAVSSPDSFLMVAESDRAVIGFVAGSLDVRALFRRFLTRDGLVVVASSPAVLLRSWPRALETMRQTKGDTAARGHGPRPNGSSGPSRDSPSRDSPSRNSSGPDAELLAIAVDPDWRGHEIGGRLVERFLSEVERRGAQGAQVVVGADNGPAIALYRRAGFVAVEAFELHRGTPSLLMRRPSPSDDRTDSPPR